MTRADEFSWIKRYLAPLSGHGAFSLQDDAAVLSTGSADQILVTQDAIHEGIHFLKSDSVFSIAQKALRVNVSDVVAKGAIPVAYSLALGVPDQWRDEDMAAFANGLAHDQDYYGLSLTGGDTYRAPGGLCVAVTMFGSLEERRYVSRLGARPGQAIFVTGTIGDAAIGLKVASGKLSISPQEDITLVRCYQIPQPPPSASQMVSQYAKASMDVSDGLIGDCRKLASASGVSAIVHRDRIPLSTSVERAVTADRALWDTVCGGGDDYQILFCVDPDDVQYCVDYCAAANIRLTQIGEIVEGEPGSLALLDAGVPVSQTEESYTHF